MKLPKLKPPTPNKKKRPSCKDKVDLALKEIENLTQEAKDFFRNEELPGKDKKNGNE